MYGYCLVHTPTSFFPFHSLPSRQRSHPWECDRGHSLLCCIAFAEGTVKLRKTCANTVGHLTICPQSTVSEKMTSRSAFWYAQAADRRLPIHVLTQRETAWFGRLPGTGHTKRYRLYYDCIIITFCTFTYSICLYISSGVQITLSGFFDQILEGSQVQELKKKNWF